MGCRLGHKINKAIERLRKRYWRVIERVGWHLTPNHFYQPIPDTSRLPGRLFRREFPMEALRLDTEQQKRLLDQFTRAYASEYNAFPTESTGNPAEFHDCNQFFNGIDAMMYHCMVRHFRPRRIVEVGSGYSTRIAAAALLRNAAEDRMPCGKLVAIEPWPTEPLIGGFPGFHKLIHADVQRVPLRMFESLHENDILFLDSSHVMMIGSDVQYELFEILPRLRPGVLIHLHDIFLPRDYPREWVIDDQRFWNEQYALHAFLMYNDSFDVTWSGYWHHLHNADQLRSAVVNYGKFGMIPGSFWIRKTR